MEVIEERKKYLNRKFLNCYKALYIRISNEIKLEN